VPTAPGSIGGTKALLTEHAFSALPRDRNVANGPLYRSAPRHSSAITEAVAHVTEKHKMPMVAPAPTTSIYRKGRKFIFMMTALGEVLLEGLVDLAAKRRLKTIAVINEDTLFLGWQRREGPPRSVALRAQSRPSARPRGPHPPALESLGRPG